MSDFDITTNDAANTDYITDRIANYNSSAGGSTLPPLQRGETQVPYVSGVQVVNISSLLGSTALTLAWTNVAFDATLVVDHYAIYYTLADGSTPQPVGPFAAKQSPARVTVPALTQIPVTFYVQTVLGSGATSPLSSSPTTAALTVPATIDGSIITAATIDATKINIKDIIVVNLTLTNNSPGAGNVAWSACTVYYNGGSYSISGGNTTGGNKYVSWAIGSGSFTESATYSPATTVFLIATNTAGTGDIAWNKIASGGVVSSHLNLATVLSGPNGSLLIDGITYTNNSPGATSMAWSACTVIYQGITYSVSSGNSGTNTWVYWQLSSPSAFQSSATYPVLGLDDFVVAINGSNGAGGTQGFHTPVLEIHDAENERLYITASNIFQYNKNSKTTVSFARSGADSGGTPASGVVRLFDGTGTGSLGGGAKIILTGTDGKIQAGTLELNRSIASADPNFKNMNSSSATAGSAGGIPAAEGYLNVLINGSAMRIPYCNV